MSLLAGLSQQGEALTAHNDDATAHGGILKPLYRDKYGVVLLGDSITAQNPGCAGLALALTEDVLLKNAGISGNKSADVLARISTITDLSPRMVILQIGTNDFLGAIPTATTIANVTEIVDILLSAGIDVKAIIPPPASPSYSAVATGNRELRKLFLSMGVECFSPWDQFIDPATGGWVSGAAANESGAYIHPVVATRNTAGHALASLLGSPRRAVLSPKINDSGLVTNSLLQNSSGGVGTGFTSIASDSTVFTVETATGFLGNVQRWVASSAIREAGPGVYYPIAISGAKRLLVTLKLSAISADSTMGTDVICLCYQSSTIVSTPGAATRWRTLTDDPARFSFIVETPAETTRIQLLVRSYPDSPSAASQCDVKVGEVGVFEL